MDLAQWYHNYFLIPPEQEQKIRDNISEMKTTPVISLTIPVYNTREDWLRQCLDSVLNQIYPNWELCLCDNDSGPETSAVLQAYADKDERIKVTRISPNEGGWKGLNAAIDIATGDFCGLLDSDDELPRDALYLIAYALNRMPRSRIIYTDEVMISSNGRILPYFKPNFNRTLLLFQHYFSHLTLYESNLIKNLKVRHSGGSYDYDLALRASEVVNDKNIYHLPVMCYKYRSYETSTSSTTTEDCMRGACKALQEHVTRIGIKGTAERNGNLYQVRLQNGSLIPRPTVDYAELLMPYPDYPRPDLNLLKLIYGD
jgi:glycosyltransferase involved in cell wall biosynthesis